MYILIIYPQTKEQLSAYESLAKAFQNRMVKTKDKECESPYDPMFVAKILKSEKNFSEGKFKVIKTEDLWK